MLIQRIKDIGMVFAGSAKSISKLLFIRIDLIQIVRAVKIVAIFCKDDAAMIELSSVSSFVDQGSRCIFHYAKHNGPMVFIHGLIIGVCLERIRNVL